MHSILTFYLLFLAAFTVLLQALPTAKTNTAVAIETRSSKPKLKGIAYNALNPDGTCQSVSQIKSTIKKMKSVGIVNIRTYAQNCDQLDTILNAIHTNGGGMTLLTGVYIDGSSNDETEISILKSVLSKNKYAKEYIRGILVGNEVVFSNLMTSSALVQKIKSVKKFAKTYKVGTVEIYTTYTKDLMDASDIVSVNLHPFFSPTPIANAFSNLNAQYTSFKKLTNKKVYITETGWPSAGNNDGSSHPSIANQKEYAQQLAQSNLPYYFFVWQDSDTKNVGPWGVEPHWGLLTTNGKFKFTF